MTPCRAVLFDLFDTLIVFERERLPEISVGGRLVRSTAGHLHEALQAFAPQVPLPDFVAALRASWEDAERIRNETHREVAAPERFGTMFRRLGVDPAGLPAEAIPTLLATHMRVLSGAMVFPDHHRDLLDRLRRRHRLAVVSNFDYTPTARHVLDRAGVVDHFDAIVVSDEVGWRKPAPVIFEHALSRLGVTPAEALFVGDRMDLDVAGAQAVGMQAAWINRAGELVPAGARPPEFDIRDLGEIAKILGVD
jgi:HAD superfamily hydrolase (TIGR01549 family)